jgi:glutaredoxin
MNARVRLLPPAISLLCLLAATASAQGVYRIVGPDGRVSYSDRPPADAKANPVGRQAGTGTPNAQLPYDLRQIASRYPVTLYTGKDCAPCNSGRNLLNARGIPYNERTISTPDDLEALRRINPDGNVPLLTIGSQRLKGYSDTEWTQYLDAAGYPKQSQLPGSYRRPAPTPLVVSRPAGGSSETDAAGNANGAEAPAEVPVAPPAENPAGIRF